MNQKQKTVSLAGLGLVFGAAFGAVIGGFFGNMSLGIALGAAFGLLFAPSIKNSTADKNAKSL
ncbi:MAG: glycine zipper family protein [Candidatus Bathyarchaeota archaeon]|nr:glycine zipper family protein [Candidatus Bathyarchaeota archaeon]